LDFHIDDAQRLGADVDLDKPGVDRLVELPEAGNEADRTWKKEKDNISYDSIQRIDIRALLNLPEGVGDWAAREHATHTQDGAKTLQQRPVKPVGNLAKGNKIVVNAFMYNKTDLASSKVLRVRRLLRCENALKRQSWLLLACISSFFKGWTLIMCCPPLPMARRGP
jgi:hypothetical protein